MAETIDEIEAHIDWTRAQLGSDFRELEEKVSAATDWRTHYERRPMVFLSVAAVGGALLASTLSGKRRHRTAILAGRSPRLPSEPRAPGQTRQLVNNVTSALIGLGAAKLTEYMDSVLPGFDDQYRRVAQR